MCKIVLYELTPAITIFFFLPYNFLVKFKIIFNSYTRNYDDIFMKCMLCSNDEHALVYITPHSPFFEKSDYSVYT